jgi:hypothetical protein
MCEKTHHMLNKNYKFILRRNSNKLLDEIKVIITFDKTKHFFVRLLAGYMLSITTVYTRV